MLHAPKTVSPASSTRSSRADGDRAQRRALPQHGMAPKSSPHRRRVATLASARTIKLIATDVDGTLLNSRQELSPEVEAAVKEAARAG